MRIQFFSMKNVKKWNFANEVVRNLVMTIEIFVNFNTAK